jgi:PAS domain S-box-containing protein
MSEVLRALLFVKNKFPADIICGSLKQGGFKPVVRKITSYRSLTSALQQDQWDIIIIDDKTAFTSGKKIYNLAEQNEQAPIPVLVIAEKLNRKKMMAALQSGACDYIPLDGLTCLPSAISKKLARTGKSQNGRIHPEDKYRQLFDNMPIGLYKSLPGGKIIDANNSLVQILGYPNKKILLSARAVKLYINLEDRKKWQKQLEEEGTLYANEVQFYRYDGSVIWVRESTRAFFDNHHRVLYYEGAIEDITLYKQTDKELRRRVREQIVMNAITANASEVEDEDSLFKHTTAIIRDLLFPDSFGILLVDEADKVLHLTHSYQTYPSDSKDLTIPLGKGVTGKSTAAGCRYPPGSGLYKNLCRNALGNCRADTGSAENHRGYGCRKQASRYVHGER